MVRGEVRSASGMRRERDAALPPRSTTTAGARSSHTTARDGQCCSQRLAQGKRVSRAGVVLDIQRTALLVDALHRGDLSLLLVATDDRLRQPARGENAYPPGQPTETAAPVPP